MAKGYSLDLRRRVWRAWQRGEGSQAKLAARFAVSVSFVRDLSRRFRESGDVAAKPYGGGRVARADATTCQAVYAQVSVHNDLSIEEHCHRLAASGHPLLSRAALGRVLLKLGLTRKKRRSATTSAPPRASKSCVKPSRQKSPPSHPRT